MGLCKQAPHISLCLRSATRATQQSLKLSLKSFFFFFYFFFPPFLYFLTLPGAIAVSALNTAFLLPSMRHYGRGFIGSRTPRLYNGSSVQGKYCTICLHAVSSLPFPFNSPTHASASGLLKQDLKNQKNERFLISPLSPASEQDI